MGASCKGICLQISHHAIPNAKKYEFGLKRCSWCEVFLSTDDVRCPCCKMILRTKSRNKKKPIFDSKPNDKTAKTFTI
tara:strand:- start:6051 stop:6284 length:234 start_codon:yes stop_codon:yes gene_type:complete